jgi:hypothetical protein
MMPVSNAQRVKLDLLLPSARAILAAQTQDAKRDIRRAALANAQANLGKLGIHESLGSLNSSLTAILINLRGKTGKRAHKSLSSTVTPATTAPKMPLREQDLRRVPLPHIIEVPPIADFNSSNLNNSGFGGYSSANDSYMYGQRTDARILPYGPPQNTQRPIRENFPRAYELQPPNSSFPYELAPTKPKLLDESRSEYLQFRQERIKDKKFELEELRLDNEISIERQKNQAMREGRESPPVPYQKPLPVRPRRRTLLDVFLSFPSNLLWYFNLNEEERRRFNDRAVFTQLAGEACGIYLD